MNRFKNILYVTEYKEEEISALREACDLAAENQADLTIASSMPDLPRALPREQLGKLRKELHSVEKHRQRFVFSEILKPFQAEGLSVNHEVLSGIPFIEIIRDVLLNRRDLVVIPASPLFADGTGFSSMVMHLMRKCPCPVWALRTDSHSPIKRVLAAIDVGHTDGVNAALNADILKIAATEAKRCEAKCDVVHAWNVPGETLLRGPLIGLTEEDWEKLYHDVHLAHLTQFDHALEEISEGFEVASHILEGGAAKVIPSMTDELEADLLVMGTLSHGGVEGYFMGHTSEEILQRTRCSVLAVKPDSFTSPVVATAANIIKHQPVPEVAEPEIAAEVL